jgi:Tfp pilus assembly PilM family ATPase
MPKLLAVEWDASEARLAVARTRGASDIVVDEAFSVDLSPKPGSDDETVNVGERIAAALAARNVGRVETLVAVGRASIELQQMSLPPAPPEELPDMVRFQAMRQFTTINDDWPLDFVQLEPAVDSDNENVLGAAISPEMVSQLRETCASADLTPKRLVLRPFAAASVVCRHDLGTQQPPRLMVDLLTDEADLTILVDQRVLLMRTVRLPSAEETTGQTRALLGQMLRTIAAAQNQLRGRRVERIVICGDGSDQTALKELVEKQLNQEVQLFDPLGQLTLSQTLQQQRPEHAGRFAPLIGLLLDEASGAAHAIDFLHPRKRPEAPNQHRRNAFIGGAVAVAALAILLLIWMQLSTLDADIADLKVDSGTLAKKVESAESVRGDMAQIDKWLASDFTWLDEMYDIAKRLPPPEDVVITQMTLGTRSPQGGHIIMDGYVRESGDLQDLQEALRAGGRSVISTGGSSDDRRETYRWRFKETVILDPLEPSSRNAEPER